MADILDELLSEEKDEKRLLLFRKIFPVIIICTIIIALIMAGYSWYSSSKTKHNQETGDLFVQLISGEYKDKELVKNLLEEIKANTDNKVAELAAIKLINEQIQDGKSSNSMKNLEKIINDKTYSEITKSYGKILFISLALDADKLSSDEENILHNYMYSFSKETQVFYATATLLKALFYLKNQEFELAKKYATEILNLSRASSIIKEQAEAVIRQIEYAKNRD